MTSVVPLVGTWIEIYLFCYIYQIHSVVPLVGTWIEIQLTATQQKKLEVVPLVGTWIEIDGRMEDNKNALCRSPRGNVD